MKGGSGGGGGRGGLGGGGQHVSNVYETCDKLGPN